MNGSEELWKQCVEWLVSIGALPPSHKTRMGGVIFDLAQTLRDGVVLCNVLNFIQPGVIDESHINLRAQMSEFLCMQNIRVVIYTLQNFFTVPQNEIFTAQDLYQMTNFGKVLECLSYLSSLPVISNRVKPFRLSRRGSRVRITPEEEDIYRNLPDLAAERSLADEDDNLYDSVPEEKEEGIYGSLIDIKKSAPSVSSKKPTDWHDKRGCCIHEIVETENNYVQHLEMMVNSFIEPLRAILQEKDIRTIFMNIEQLLPIHSKFRDELVKLQRSGPSAKFSQPFLNYKDKFLIYGDYCSNMADAQDYLEDLMKGSEPIRMKIQDCQMNSSRNKFKLRELLCVPMQRILKYHLLVKELNKHTTDSHVDKPNMPLTLTSMQELSQYINEVKRDSEELIKINQIESSLDGYNGIPLRAYGRVRKDGELKVRFADDRTQSLRNAFLFDKALFTTKLKNDTYYLKDLLRLEDMKLDESLPPNARSKWSWSWSLSSMMQGVKGCTLYAKTESDRTKWLEAFKDAFDNISPRALKGKKHNFEMQTFSEPTNCNSCDMLLKGIFYQGYQCTVTNARCHKSCLADTLKLIENNSIGAKLEAEANELKPPPVPGRGKKRNIQSIKTSAPTPEVSLSYKAHRDYNGTPAPPFSNAPVITFRIGEPIDVIEQVTPDWWKGNPLGDFNQVGYFPASYVSPVNSEPQIETPVSFDVQSQRAPRASNYVDNPIAPASYQSSVRGPSQPIHPLQEEPIEEFPWYAGEIGRPEAERILYNQPTGTFLVREKKAPPGLVISLKFNKDIKHIKILQTADNLHYVAECKNFRCVQDLIKFYQANSLSAFFLGLETTLRYPYRDPVMFPGVPSPNRVSAPQATVGSPIFGRDASLWSPTQDPHSNGWQAETTGPDGRIYEIIGRARALYDFEPRSYQELPLKAGQAVNIVSKHGGVHGWWKGEYNGQIGYFPTTFVVEGP